MIKKNPGKDPGKDIDKRGFFGWFSIGQFVFTAVYLFVIWWFQYTDIWNRHFDNAGGIYILYNFFRVIFLLFFAWILYSLGRPLFFFATRKNKELELESLDVFLISSFLGASFLVVLLFVLGLLKLYYLSIALLVTVPIIFLSYRNFKKTVKSIQGFFVNFRNVYFRDKGRPEMMAAIVFSLVILFEAGYLLVSKGLMPDLLTNDTIGHYLPYYQEVLQSHSLWMNKYFFHYYYSKGSVLFFLSGLLTDIQSFQTISFCFFLLTALALYSYVKKISDKASLWPLLAVIVYFSSGIILNETGMAVAEFQKAHVVVGSFIIMTVFMTVLLFSVPEAAQRRWIFIQLFIAAAVIIMSPVAVAFVLPYMALQAMYFRALKNDLMFKYSLGSASLILVVFACLLALNYFSSGLVEATPLPVFFKYRNEAIMSQWVSPLAFLFQIRMNTLSGEGAGAITLESLFKFTSLIENITEALHDRSFIPYPAYLILVIAAIVLATIAFRKRVIARKLLDNIVPAGFIMLVSFFLSSITRQTSIFRYTEFLIFFKIAVYVYIFIFLTMLFGAGKAKKQISLALVGIAAVFAIVNFYSYSKSGIVSAADKLNFLAGGSSYADLYENRWGAVRMGLTTQQGIGYDKKVLVMNFLPGLYGMPRSGFQRPLMNAYNKNGDFESIMFGTPEKAIEALKKNNVNYFMFVIDKPLLFTAYAPLFEPQNIRKYFKSAGTGDKVLLLTWRSEKEPELNDIFVTAYRNIRESGRMHPYAQTFESVKNMQMPGYNESGNGKE